MSDLQTTATGQDIDMHAEVEIIEALERLVDLAVAANLNDTIAYVSCCRALVYERRKRRLRERQ